MKRRWFYILVFLACSAMAAKTGLVMGAPGPPNEVRPGFSYDAQRRILGEIDQYLLKDLKREYRPEGASEIFPDENDDRRENPPVDPEIILQYYSLISDTVASNWITPTGDLPADLTCTVEIPVEADGRTAGPKMRKSSGNPDFDQSILLAIEKSTPFPPLPREFRGQTARVWIMFYSEVMLRLERERKGGQFGGQSEE